MQAAATVDAQTVEAVIGTFISALRTFWSHTEGLLVVRQLICALVQFLPGQLRVLVDHRHGIGCAFYLGLEELMDTPLLGVRCRGGIPFHQQLLPLCRHQDLQLAEALLGISHDAL